jgi:hypothetical protein
MRKSGPCRWQPRSETEQTEEAPLAALRIGTRRKSKPPPFSSWSWPIFRGGQSGLIGLTGGVEQSRQILHNTPRHNGLQDSLL